jgi:predicted ferric reductase
MVRFAVLVLALWPLAVLGPGPWAGGPADAAGVLRWLGRAAGVVGLAWLLLAMVLSIRLPRLDAALGGLLRLWRVHHRLGAASFVLLMLHPVLLALAAVPAGPDAVLATLTPPFDVPAVWAGWGALVLMMVFLAPSFSFFGPPDYQRWKWLHRLSGLVVALGLYHALALPRSFTPAAAAWTWGGLAALAAAAFAWRLLLSRRFARRRYRIAKVDPLAERVVELTLEGPPLRFDAGQFVYLAPLDPALSAGRGEEHPYSLVSAPQEPSLRIAVKDLGDASGALMTVAEGSEATVEGPYGRFLPRRHGRPALWIGGGIGITPFVSAARGFRDVPVGDAPVDVRLVYCANDPGRAYYLQELEAIAAGRQGFAVHAHYFVDEGPLGAAFLDARAPDFRRRACYVCGPGPLLELAERLLRREGVPRRRITLEAFDLL